MRAALSQCHCARDLELSVSAQFQPLTLDISTQLYTHAYIEIGFLQSAEAVAETGELVNEILQRK